MALSATVGNLGERGEPDILTLVRHWDLLRALRTGQSTRDLHFKHESELHGNGEVGIEPGTFGVLASVDLLDQFVDKLRFICSPYGIFCESYTSSMYRYYSR